MEISDKIGSSHVEAMNKILTFITFFNVSKLLYAISAKRMDEDTIRSITLDIREQNVRLDRQKGYLFKFGKTFNQEWATDDNQCFDTSARLSFRMRSGIKGIKNQVRLFCKPSRRRLLPGQEAPQAIDRSLIAAGEAYMRDLFGLDSYPQCVKELFAEMIAFHQNIHDCLEESLRVLSEEKETRADWRKCVELLKQAIQKSRKNMIVIVQEMGKNPALKEVLMKSDTFKPTDANPVLKAWANSGGSEEKQGAFASTFFHNCSLEDVSKITINKTFAEAEGDAGLMECMAIFNCDAPRARTIDDAIRRFDSLLPEKCKAGRVPAIYLHVFMRWCSEGIGYETFLNYFNKRYTEARGKWKPVGKSALSGASVKHARDDESYLKAKKEMTAKLDKMFPQEEKQEEVRQSA